MARFSPFRVTAHLATPFAACDDWSPALDAILEWLLLEQFGLTSPNPSEEQIQQTRSLVFEHLPLQRGEINGEWYWCVSSPCYQYKNEQRDKFRKRWDYHDYALNWGKRKAKWSTSDGGEKSYDLPLYLRLTPTITWYCVGDKKGIEELLQGCPGVGKKRSYGHGQVSKWEVSQIKEDWHLWRNGKLMRPMPYIFLMGDANVLRGNSYKLMEWGWRPPARMQCNQTLCIMPEVVCRSL